MESKEYQIMYDLEDRHWWFQSRLMMTEGLLDEYILPDFRPMRPRLLDLGCGTGLFLERRGADAVAFGLDFSREALSFCRSRKIESVLLGDAAHLPIKDAAFDVVTAFDLIEHVPNDRALIREIWRILRPGGYLLATVPAHPVLWTGHDVSLHHRRRYRRRTFESLFEPARWSTVRMTASFALIFPPAALIRGFRRLISGKAIAPHSDTHPTADWLNRTMIALHRMEVAWLRRHDLPVGISFLTIRRKRRI